MRTIFKILILIISITTLLAVGPRTENYEITLESKLTDMMKWQHNNGWEMDNLYERYIEVYSVEGLPEILI